MRWLLWSFSEMLVQLVCHSVRQLWKLFPETFVHRAIVRLQRLVFEAEVVQLPFRLLQLV